jgi:large conductance mechanosensitive channel
MARGNGGFWSDFWKFLAQGNVIDLAVAVIIGGAFGKIIDSLIKDIITPLILSPVLAAAGAKDLESWAPHGIKWGVFLSSIISFVVIALVIFVILQALERTKKKLQRQQAEAEAAAPPDPAVVAQERTADALDRLAQALESRSL